MYHDKHQQKLTHTCGLFPLPKLNFASTERPNTPKELSFKTILNSFINLFVQHFFYNNREKSVFCRTKICKSLHLSYLSPSIIDSDKFFEFTHLSPKYHCISCQSRCHLSLSSHVDIAVTIMLLLIVFSASMPVFLRKSQFDVDKLRVHRDNAASTYVDEKDAFFCNIREKKRVREFRQRRK